MPKGNSGKQLKGGKKPLKRQRSSNNNDITENGDFDGDTTEVDLTVPTLSRSTSASKSKQRKKNDKTGKSPARNVVLRSNGANNNATALFASNTDKVLDQNVNKTPKLPQNRSRRSVTKNLTQELKSL